MSPECPVDQMSCITTRHDWEVAHLTPAALLVELVIVATNHVMASLMVQIATTVLAAVDDRHCPKTQTASRGTVGSVNWYHLMLGQEVNYVALAGDKFRSTGHLDDEGIVDCIQRSVILGHFLKTTESQRTMMGEMVVAARR